MPSPTPKSVLSLLFVTALLAVPSGFEAAPPQERGATRQEDSAAATVESVGLPALGAALNELLSAGAGDTTHWSVLAVSLDRGDTLLSRSPGQALAPASNMKLFTSAAALEHLGPDYRYATYLVTDGRIEDGVLRGNLYLYGTGDPTLGKRFAGSPAPALVGLADSLAALGIREVDGDLIGDGSYFSGSGSGEGWPQDDLNAWYAAPAGGLSVHENLVRIEVEPGPGGEPRLDFTPGGQGLPVRVESGGGGRVSRESYGGPIVARVSGGSAEGAVAVDDAALYAASLMRKVLHDAGIVLRGGVGAVEEQGGSLITGRGVVAPAFEKEPKPLRVLAVNLSEPLSEILHVVNHQSHNFYAEQVLRTLGREEGGDGSAASGAAVVEALLERAGVDTAAVRVVDGGGLSPLNRVSAGAFVQLLAYMAESPRAEAFMATLPVAGEVRRFRRMGGTPAGGNLQAKTGTIEDVSALSGYVTAADGERIAFSIISNGLRSVSRGKHVENEIGVLLASFHRGAPTGPPMATADRDAGP